MAAAAAVGVGVGVGVDGGGAVSGFRIGITGRTSQRVKIRRADQLGSARSFCSDRSEREKARRVGEPKSVSGMEYGIMKKNLPETGKKATGMTASVDQP